MPQNSKKYNSINDITAQQMRNNQNTNEILTKIDQALHSNDSFVTLKVVDSQGKETVSQFPTIGYLKQELDRISKTVKILSGIEGNPASVQIAQNAYKRIITADLNLEPKKIDNLDPVSVFKTNPNWIFDSFLNPKISVELDLTNKIDKYIRQIQCRRFIIEFDRVVTVDAQGNEVINFTTAGQARLDEFNTLYKGKSNIDLIEFVQWMQQVGVVNRIDNTLIDEDYFKIEPNILKYKGNFSVLHTEVDAINKKLWYALDSLTYYDVSNPDSPPAPVQLKVGDLVNVDPNLADVVSTTVYKVIEISNVTSDLRVRFEQVYGEEPIPVRINALAFYSDIIPERKVRISIGFDERNVLFVRPFDDDNNLQGKDWSSGIGFYTNELTLDNSNGEQFSEYYVKQVYDYGLVIEDLVQKKVPNYYGIKPNSPVLTNTNFKVVQINQHLTNTVEAEKIRDLHNNKNDLSSQISQLQTAVESKNRFLETTQFDSQAERKKAQDELVTLQSKLTTKNETKYTLVKDILASKKNLNKIDPKFKIRGFWPMPDAVTTSKTTPQEVVQFEVWYRYLNKSGAENPIATFTDIVNSAAQLSSSQNTTVNANLTRPNKVNAAFSNWTKFKTDARKRTQDPLTGEWKWHIEDVQDANTPNINQLDISINPGERVEIKIKALSEVGWPETPVESDFSELLTVDFPDDLNSVLSDDQFILKEASADDLKVNFERDLDARGLGLHLNSAIRADNIYYAHKADAIASGFKDSGTGSIINLYDQLLIMVNRLTSLEEQIARGKGELEVFIINKGVKTKVFNGNSLTFNLNLEDFMIKTKIGILGSEVDNGARCYKNDIYTIENYVLEIRNNAQTTPLGLLSYRNYAQLLGGQSSPFTWKPDNGVTNLTKYPQAVWLDKNNNIVLKNYSTTGTAVDNKEGPDLGTQINNQWIWLQNSDDTGKPIYADHRQYHADNIVAPLPELTNQIPRPLAPTPTNLSAYHFNSTGTSGAWSVGLNVGHIPRMPCSFISIPGDWYIPKDISDNGNNGLSSEYVFTTNSKNLNAGFITNQQYNTNSPINTVGATTLDTQKFIVDEEKHWSIMTKPNSTTVNYTSAREVLYAGLGTAIFPIISDTNSITDTSAQKVKLINPGDANVFQIPIKIFFRPFTGNLIYNTNTDITRTTVLTEFSSLPLVTSISIVSGKLQVVLSSANTLKVGDKLVLSGMTDTTLLNANNKPILIQSILGNNVLLSYNASTSIGSANLEQIHFHTCEVAKVGQYRQYTVYGNDVFIKNYIEFYSPSLTPTPVVHTKKLRFFLEEESKARPFEFQFNWNMTHYKRVSIITSAATASSGISGLIN